MKSEGVSAGMCDQDLVELTRALVQLDSQTPPSDTGATACLAASVLADLPNVRISLHKSEIPVLNLVAELDGGLPGPRTILSGHLDTYPIGIAQDWTRDPLGGEISDGRIYGRGAADMKGAVAVLLAVMREFSAIGRFNGSIVLALAGDEERMGELGTQRMIDDLPEIHGDGVLVADVGGPQVVRIGEKGMLWLNLQAEGQQAHGAHVYAGENALDRLIDALTALRGIEDLTPTPPADAVAVMAAAADNAGADNSAARAVMGRVTVNLGTLSGGLTSNLVPSGASAGVDIRIPVGLDTAEVLCAVERVLAAHTKVTFTVVRRYEATWTPSDTPLIQACLRGVEAGLGRKGWTDNRIGGSDSRLWRRAGFACAAIGLNAYNLGAPDEYCVISELVELKDVYVAILRDLHGVS